MEVYIEIIILCQCLIHGCCYLSTMIFLNQLVDKKQMMKYLIYISFISFNIYFKFSNFLLYGYLLLIHFLLFKKEALLFSMSYLICFYFYVLVCLQFLSGTFFQNGLLIFSDLKQISKIFSLLFFSILSYMIHGYFVKKKWAFKSLYYQVEIILDNQSYVLNGYLDTGNLARFKGLPIIFVKSGIIKSHFDDVVLVQGINGLDYRPAKKIEHILINQKAGRSCYLVESSTLTEFDCLLNRALLMEGV